MSWAVNLHVLLAAGLGAFFLCYAWAMAMYLVFRPSAGDSVLSDKFWAGLASIFAGWVVIVAATAALVFI